jgi:hypothetical protein
MEVPESVQGHASRPGAAYGREFQLKKILVWLIVAAVLLIGFAVFSNRVT